MRHRRSHRPSRQRLWQLPGAKIQLTKKIFLIADVVMDDEDMEDVGGAGGVAVAVGP